MKKGVIIVYTLIILIALLVSFFSWKMFFSGRENEEDNQVLIGFSQGSTIEEHWKTDSVLFSEKISSLGGVVKHVISDNDVEKQISQIEELIKEGVKAIVIIPSDLNKLSPAIEKAREAGVKTIAYDQMIKNGNLDFYISFDNVRAGELQAESVISQVAKGNFAYIGGSSSDNNANLEKDGSMNVLNPRIKKGDIDLMIDKRINNWNPEEAYETIRNYLSSGKKLNAVVVADDGLASGVIQALEEYDLAGLVSVSGQGADLSACQRIVAGTQSATVYRPIRLLAEKAAEIAFSLAIGQKPETNSVVASGKGDVPSYLLAPTLVNKDNMKTTVISDNFHTYEEVYGEVEE